MSTTPTHTIREATASDVANIATALSAAFSDDPVLIWVFPDLDDYALYSTRYFTSYTHYVIDNGAAWTTGEPNGAYITLPFEAWKRSKVDADLQEGLAEAAGPHAERAAAMDRAFVERHPTDRDHLYGAFVGVAPGHRGLGIGSGFFRAWTAEADRQGLPCYLEATCDANRRLYERFGFRQNGDPIVIPGCPQALFPMWRPPQA